MKIALIDFDELVYKIGFASEKRLDKDFRYTDPIGICLNKLKNKVRNILKSINTSKYKGFLTSNDKSNFRFNLAKTKPYKGNRKDLEKPYYYDNIRDYLVTYYNTDIISDMEADDSLSIAQHYLTKKNKDSIICSTDKDLNQTIGKHFNIKHEEFYEISKIEGFRNFCKQILSGDRSDNIPGLYGYGESKPGVITKGDKILNECKSIKECWKKVIQEYKKYERIPTWSKGSYESYLDEQASLLYLLREEDDSWQQQKILLHTSRK